MDRNPFSEAEIAGRLSKVRTALAERKLDAVVFASPETVFYLTGLDHWGYFAPHLLIVTLDRRPILVTRSMEKVTIENQVKAAEFRGHSDSETAADLAARVISELGLAGKRIGIENWTSGLSHGLALKLEAQADAKWSDVSGLVDKMRLVKSAEEQVLMRRAAKVTDAGAGAAIAAISDGAAEQEVAAQCVAAMVRAGGHAPGFGPFIRPAARLGEEHTTWGDGIYRSGEPVFVELSGCVSRYHAPLGRLIRIGNIKDEDAAMAEVTAKAFEAVVRALEPGARARDIYAAWQGVADEAGLSHYRRHHCGYLVGIGQPPSWTGGNSVTGLRHDSDLEIETGMSFHILSWLMGTGRGDHFISNTVLLTDAGAEVLTRTPAGPIVR
ncbi:MULTISPECIES: Xaa-Pro peptidase family protein [unclassified Mesorhizobium]|uniref:M24 family metallopeptidase n=1 Tax=unclassified Mesorhizobium TaxID=325217 RepID=UPI00112945FD|nr:MULTISPECIES: Xaa-Pro peptidase family protein [unclassified Mesorhizobium]MCA0028705.1 Xaa-Pro peptidase family protein [Mesorhizobium sp. B263B1A]TPJ92296.1 aminopeptidase P family protein [Mesorhizobium sp. B2-5-12]TPK21305.1 aminopeptidase P family protein [Mesorhizobium sp. B2-5-6]TPN28908.1 aminopeptidase P family protein [Mesorhizobium sp. B1-1-6]